ncbi:zinc carboxypeptidase-like [Leguminivora glycinivorella]|uniref:zinc carboxypeptidase-like n=1 Tax=Leguminivora glycinivorella TaxID=1035111 RepID=UPI00200EED0A|nr:zinc carboxypeptidase-like [Leguminivora glycinivorella]
MKSLIYALLLAYLSNGVLSEKFRYDNYTVFRIHMENEEQMKVLKDLQDTDFRFDFWTPPEHPSKLVQVMAGPEDKDDLQKLLTEHNMIAEISMNNVQEFIDKQTIKRYTRNEIGSMTWNAYYSLEDIYAWLDDVVAQYPDVATKVIGGQTYEGREIVGIKISHGPGKKNIFIEGGIHAREWISPPTVCFIIHELLTSPVPENMAAARDFDWHIFPVVNPDGYKFSFESQRFWRKNRRVFSNGIGVDLNRNWNSNWLVHGASTNPSSDIYAGTGPFSEIETRSLSRYMRAIGDQMQMFLTFHSYGQMLLLPFGNTSEPLANYNEAMNIGRRAMGALSVRYGTEYVTGNIVEVLYEATGGTDEWVKEHLHVPIVYCYELRDQLQYGFLLPPEQILPTGLETMDSVVDLIHQMKRFGTMASAGVAGKASMMMLLGIVMEYFL